MSGCATIRVLFAAACGALLGGVALLGTPPAHAQESDNLLAKVRAAWEKREAAAKVVRLSWTMKDTTPKGAVTARLPRVITEGKIYPPQDVTHNGTATLLFDGTKTRYTLDRMEWAQKGADFTRVRRDAAFNDGRSTVLHHYGNQNWPQGTISKESGVPEFDISSWPALVAFRGTSADTMNRMDLRIFTQARPILAEGRSLVEISRPRNEQYGEAILWLDPNQDYAVVRHEIRSRSGSVQLNARVAQKRDRSGVWVPASWTVVAYDGQQLARSVSATVTECMVNPPTTDDDFRITFPPGTRVVDHGDDTPREYIVREAQPPREILPSEIGAPYSDLVRTETGELGTEPTSGLFARYRYWVIGAVVLVIVLAIGLRFRRKNRVPPSTSTEA